MMMMMYVKIYSVNVSFVKIYAVKVSHSLLRGVNEFLSPLSTFRVPFG